MARVTACIYRNKWTKAQICVPLEFSLDDKVDGCSRHCLIIYSPLYQTGVSEVNLLVTGGTCRQVYPRGGETTNMLYLLDNCDKNVEGQIRGGLCCMLFVKSWMLESKIYLYRCFVGPLAN